jgi:hypothetical protein
MGSPEPVRADKASPRPLAFLAACCIWGVLAASAAGQPAASSYILKGELLKIEADIYVVRDLQGRFIRLRTDKNTKLDRMIVPGEKIEAEVSANGLALSIKPAS